MTAEREGSDYARVLALFEEAVELPVQERQSFLKRRCGEDSVLLGKLRRLLDQDEEGTKSYLVSPVGRIDCESAGHITDGDAQVFDDPEWIDGYRIVEPLGEGGMGRVFLAEQEEPVHRLVALKVVRLRADVARVTSRFEQEREVLARMQHPNVCRILDGGTTQAGLPYFVMDYVEGARSLTDYAREKSLSARERLELFLPICRAVIHGHEKGVLHRDLKPSNILVSAEGVPKLIDFGVARSLEADLDSTTRMTEAGQLMGTLQYMSPEQLEASGSSLDERSDLYSLGVILYELLTERLPYDVSGKSIVESARIIQEEPPARIRGTSSSLRGDLETILRKSLEKDPDHRFGSVKELAADIERFLRFEPIRARPPSFLYQLRLFTRRHKGLAVGLAMTFSTLIAGFLVSLSWALRAERAREDAEAVQAFLEESLISSDPQRWNKTPTVLGLLNNMTEELDERFADRPVIQGRLLASVGHMYGSLAERAAAKDHLTRAIDLLDETLGPDHEETLRARVALSSIYLDFEHEQLRSLLADLLPRLRRTFDPDDPTRWRAELNAGLMDLYHGHPDEARETIEEVVEMLARTLGEEHPDTLEARSALGSCYGALGRAEEAEALMTEVLDVEKKVLGETRTDSLLNLGFFYADQGRIGEAESMFLDSYQREAVILGNEHPRLLDTLMMLSDFYIERDRIRDAESILQQALEMGRRVLGPDHYKTLRMCRALGAVYAQTGFYEESEALLDESVAGMRKHEDRAQDLAYCLSSRASLMAATERAEKAQEDFLAAYSILVEELGSEHEESDYQTHIAERLLRHYGYEDLAEGWHARHEPLEAEEQDPEE